MIKSCLLWCVLLITVSNAHADPIIDQNLHCFILGTFAFSIGLNKIEGVPRSEAWNALILQNGQIESTLEPQIKHLIKLYYNNRATIDISELSASVVEVFDNCIKEIL